VLLRSRTLHPVAMFRIPAPAIPLEDVIHAAAHKYQVPSAFVKSIIAAESHFSPNVVSPKGAIGLMQLMPATARQLGADPAVPEQNVDAGTNYLSWLLHRYANKRTQLRDAIAAYNAGPGAVERYRGVPPYRETRAYVKRVLTFFAKYQREEGQLSSIPAVATAMERPRHRYMAASLTSRGVGRCRGRRANCRVHVTAA